MASINLSNCSWKDLVKVARKCGFSIFEGGKHTKIKDKNGRFITTIPRANRLNKYTVKGILKALEKAGCKFK